MNDLDGLIVDEAWDDAQPRPRPRMAQRLTAGQVATVALVVGAGVLAALAGLALHPVRTWRLLKDHRRRSG